MPLPVTGTVEVTGGEEGFRLTNDVSALCNTCIFAAGSTSTALLSGPVTAVSFFSDRRASFQFQKDSEVVHHIFLEAGDSVNVTFPHPIDADRLVTSCSSGGDCSMRYAISGYVESP